ncbi:alpha-L-rhamnosidase C-terminal domain-containing protein [Cerasicoccus frondis]|uniref:alpha-L-rhamnosidase-related protein n=1 Tax=Cerasicoccus frondis TaxID=490090 RepID=UPI002852C6E4|nr:alpha-L-rhamnosidase C-terminal domain-containing protein [Cerasicoccus frondis]
MSLQTETIVFHISADQRFQLKINGKHAALGPDRSDVHHWSIASYRVELPMGCHEFEALVWWLPEDLAPMAQVTHCPGFLLAGEGEWAERMNTGIANWEACDLSKAIHCSSPSLTGYLVVGPEFQFAMPEWRKDYGSDSIKIVRPPLSPEKFGTRAPGWRIQPTAMLEQDFAWHACGRIAAFRDCFSDESITASDTIEHGTQRLQWDSLLKHRSPLQIAPHQSIDLIIDCENYVCGYPSAQVEYGQGSEIEIQWAESLYEAEHASKITESTSKGHRDKVIRKSFIGLGDRWKLCGAKQNLPALWWRSGRYLRVRIQTSDEALHIHAFGIHRTGYPFSENGKFSCDNQALINSWPMLIAGLRNCAHEQWIDCPYYEQLSYVGDNVCELAFYCVSRDASLSKRCLELFDWSRHDGGWVAERYPSAHRQDSFTYSLLYPRLLRDHAYWRRDPAFMRDRLPGLRALIAECLQWVQDDGLVGQVPGWSFIDWVGSWENGCGPGVAEGDSSLVNLHLLFSLKDYADIEQAYGAPALAEYARLLVQRTGQAIKERYWRHETKLLADDSSGGHFSEHAQTWALLAGILTDSEKNDCLHTWLERQDELAPMSIYFSYYGLDALYHMGADVEFYRRLSFWENLPQLGFTTTPERPEPSRSDCHGWGAHPIYHAFSSMAGIRPTSPEFKHIRIAPMPGTMNHIHLSMPHPDGCIRFDWSRNEDEETYHIEIPAGTTATWERNGETIHFDHTLTGKTSPATLVD